MRKWPVIVVLAGILAGVVWYLGRAPKPPVATNSTPNQQVVTEPPAGKAKPSKRTGETNVNEPVAAAAATSAVPAAILTPPAPPRPTTPYVLGTADAPPAMDPATVLSNMRIVIRQYGSRFGGNPVGTNEEITRALNGENPKEVRFITEESGLRINGRGELVDYWGTPFFFHQLSGTEMEIHSAGPDRVMWTADDLVTK